MNLTFYDENLLMNGNHSGEDAHPFASDKLLIVADGLGGSGAFNHKNMNDKLFDPDQLDSVFSFNGDKELEDYAKLMFSEFYRPVLERDADRSYPFPTFPLMDPSEYVKADPERIALYKEKKKSGYFASHIVAVLVRKFFDEKKINACFEAVHGAETDKEKIRETLRMGEELSSFIKERMRQVAEATDLTKDKPTNANMVILPTTLVTALINEPEDADYAEAILLWAGDSRGFCFTKDKGLQQITVDEESASGVMTNRISFDGNYTINGNYVRIPKPCTFMLTSDGFFDYFTEDINIEYFVQYALLNSNNAEELKGIFSQLFRAGYLDDSCTFSMRLSGQDLDGFREVANSRNEFFKKEYIAKVPMLFQDDYANKYERISDNFKTIFARSGENFREILTAYVEEQSNLGNNSKLSEEIESLKEAVEKELQNTRDEMAEKKVVLENLCCNYRRSDKSIEMLKAEDKEKFDNAVDRILNPNYSTEMLSLLPDEEATELKKYIDEYNALRQKTERLTSDKDARMKECFKNYMLLRAPDLIADRCMKDPGFFAEYVGQDPSLRSTLRECKNGDANKSDYACLCEIVDTYRKVETIYQDYEKVYFAYLGGIGSS